MLDREIVAAVVAGDPAGLEAAYDRYAPGLYAYCRSLLTEPADAADAVQDTFIIAAGKLPRSAIRSGSAPGCTRWPGTSAAAVCGQREALPRSTRPPG
jgi:DNA-directed RNA polymerase specialized sigma24 family protein